MPGFREILRQAVRSIGTNSAASERWQVSLPLAWRQAEERANHLLRANLSTGQRDEYESRRYFEVTGGDTGTRYRIRHGHQLNVEELDQTGRRVRMLCFLPAGDLPDSDIMLAQKIALELFESRVLSIANRSPAHDDRAIADMRLARRSGRR